MTGKRGRPRKTEQAENPDKDSDEVEEGMEATVEENMDNEDSSSEDNAEELLERKRAEMAKLKQEEQELQARAAEEKAKQQSNVELIQKLEEFRLNTMVKIPLVSVGKIGIIRNYLGFNWLILYNKTGAAVQQIQIDGNDYEEFKQNMQRA